MEKNLECIIIGTGLAALSAAARMTELGVQNIAVYASAYGGTPYIAAVNFVLPDNPYGDTPKQYEEDMLHAGYEIGNHKLVQEMTSRTMDGYHLLTRWGIDFAKNEDGSTMLRHLSGHTYPRSLCCTTELIGVELEKKLTEGLKQKGVSFFIGYECVKMLSEQNQAVGAVFKNPEGKLEAVYAPVVIAAWGGVGNLFGTSTYPKDVKGNTLAIAKEAGAKLVDIEFLEYEPMVVMYPEGAVGEPCPTAMLGEGAYLKNSEGERFLLSVRPQGEGGAPKTLINKQIWKEVDAGRGTPHGGAWVDLRHIDRKVLKAYPWFFNRLMDNGVDPNKELVEVGPMAHSFSGGILVDGDYASTVDGFYAIGEASGGIHGACRCAGNAASQAVLSGLICGEAVAKRLKASEKEEFWQKAEAVAKTAPETEYREKREIYEKYVPQAKKLAVKALGIYRSGAVLEEAYQQLQDMLHTKEIAEDTQTVQIIEAICLMVMAAENRKESRGTHMRLDYPNTETAFEKEFPIE